MAGIGLELLAKAADVNGHRGAVGDLEAPDVVEELLAGEDLTRVAREEGEQVELERGQGERDTPGLGLPAAGIDRDVGGDERYRVLGRSGRPGRAAAQDRLDPRGDFTG